jgi:uncharacterized protein (TIGR02246 family)
MTGWQLILGVTLISVAISCEPSPESTPASAPDTAAVRAALDSGLSAYYAARKRNDPVASAAMYTDDAVLMVQGAADARGRPAIEDVLRGFAAESASQSHREALHVHGDRAYEAWRGSSVNTKTGQREFYKWIVFWRRDADGRWRVERDLTTTDVAPR